jgi:hypothetical protein
MAETVWTLNDVAPASVGQEFAPPASESTAVYWGGPSSMAFAAATGDVTALPAGVSSTSAIGTVTATGAALVVPAGVSSTSAIGTPTAGVAATATPSGIASTSAIGSVSATGAGKATPAGVSSSSAIGTATAGVSGTATPAGVSSSSAIGDPVASGTAMIVPAGIQTFSAIGAISSGESAETVITGGGGRILRPYRIHNIALVEGVSSRSAIGQPIVHGDAVAQPKGVASRSAIGTVTAGVVVHLVALPRSASAIGQVQAVAVYRQPAIAYSPAERPAVAHPTVPLTSSRMGYARAFVAQPTPDDRDLLALLDEVAA